MGFCPISQFPLSDLCYRSSQTLQTLRQSRGVNTNPQPEVIRHFEKPPGNHIRVITIVQNIDEPLRITAFVSRKYARPKIRQSAIEPVTAPKKLPNQFPISCQQCFIPLANSTQFLNSNYTEHLS